MVHDCMAFVSISVVAACGSWVRAGVLQQIARSKVMHGKPKAYWMPGDGEAFLAWL